MPRILAQIIFASPVLSASPQRSVLKYRPYHKYSSISISITPTAMKGFSSRMNTKTFGEVDVISRPVYIRAPRSEVYEFIIASFWETDEARVPTSFIYLFRHIADYAICHNTIFIRCLRINRLMMLFSRFDIIDEISIRHWIFPSPFRRFCR